MAASMNEKSSKQFSVSGSGSVINGTEGKLINETDVSHSKDLLNVGSSNFESKLLLKQRKTFKACPSSVLQSVKNFLPMMESANKSLHDQLEQGDREDFDIENVDNQTGPIIEMDLAIFQENSDSEDSDYSVDSEKEEGKENGLVSSSDSDNDDNDFHFSEITEKNIKICKSKIENKRPVIEELSSDPSDKNTRTSDR